jgi:hypothetical protein
MDSWVRRTFFNTVLVRSLLVGIAGNTLNAFVEVVLGWSALLGFLAFCVELAYGSTPRCPPSIPICLLQQPHSSEELPFPQENSAVAI